MINNKLGLLIQKVQPTYSCCDPPPILLFLEIEKEMKPVIFASWIHTSIHLFRFLFLV